MKTLVEVSERELEVLENIYSQEDHVRQRDLARIVGLSLGMTNAIVKRLVQKGLLTIRKVNNRNIRYAVSSAGIDQITRRSYRYLKRTIKNIVLYRAAIERLVQDVRSRGYRGLLLVGASDIDFIVEHTCGTIGIEYVRNDRTAAAAGKDPLFVLYSENYVPTEEEQRAHPNAEFLKDVVAVGERV
jgi:DNA-binding MarR family transcriptional regulator